MISARRRRRVVETCAGPERAGPRGGPGPLAPGHVAGPEIKGCSRTLGRLRCCGLKLRLAYLRVSCGTADPAGRGGSRPRRTAGVGNAPGTAASTIQRRRQSCAAGEDAGPVSDRGWGPPERVRGEWGADEGGIALTSADVVVVVGDSPVSRRRVRPRAPTSGAGPPARPSIETQCCKGSRPEHRPHPRGTHARTARAVSPSA